MKMFEYIFAPEAAKKWGISERRVQKLCEENRIPGIATCDQPEIFTQDFSKYIVFVNDTPEIKQTGHFDNAGPEDMTAFIGVITGNEKDYAYVLYFPMNIQKVTVPEPEPLFLSAFQCAKTDTLHLRLIKIE